MPIIDDVMERDRGAIALAVADAHTYADARTIEFASVTTIAPEAPAAPVVSRDEVVGALQALSKRAADVAVAATVLAISLPVIAFVALLVVLDSRGPVFYRAARVGRGG